MYRASCALVALLSTIAVSHARLVNVTIDDTYGDAWTGQKVAYSDAVEGQAETWNGVTNTDPFRPTIPLGGFDWEKPENGSLHFTTAWTKISFSIDFEGSAIYVFFILSSDVTTNLTWFVDDNSTTESFTHKDITALGDARSFYTYNVAVFSRENLDYGHHQAVISTSPIGGDDSVASMQALFDYALYTTDTDAIRPGNGTGGTAPPRGATQTKQHRTATIIAVSLVCGILIAAVAVGYLYLWRRRRLRRAAAATTPWDDNGGVPEPYPVGVEGARGGKAVFQALFHAKGLNESEVLEPYPVGGPRTEKAFLGLFGKPARVPTQAKVQFEKPLSPAARLPEPEPALEPGSNGHSHGDASGSVVESMKTQVVPVQGQSSPTRGNRL